MSVSTPKSRSMKNSSPAIRKPAASAKRAVTPAASSSAGLIGWLSMIATAIESRKAARPANAPT